VRHILRQALGISECEVVVGFDLEQMCDPSGCSSCWWRSSRCWHQYTSVTLFAQCLQSCVDCARPPDVPQQVWPSNADTAHGVDCLGGCVNTADHYNILQACSHSGRQFIWGNRQLTHVVQHSMALCELASTHRDVQPLYVA